MPLTRDPAGSVAVAFMAMVVTFMALGTTIGIFLVAAFLLVTFLLVTSIIVSSRQGERRRDEYAVLHFTSHVSLGAARTKTDFVRWDFHAHDPVGFAVYALVAVTTRLPVLRSKSRWARGR